jgi:hypothetical protein
MSKGVAQTNGLQLLARGELGVGALFVGLYGKSVDSASSRGEAGAFVGLRAKAGEFDLAASAALKRAIDSPSGSDRKALELSAAASGRLGRLAPRLSVIWSPNDVGSTGRSVFTEAGASCRLSSPLSASAAFGRRVRGSGPDYFAWNLGVSWQALKSLAIDLRYYDTDGGRSETYRARGVLSARARF